jgi:DNA-binding IclR family transcriptional regulator
MVDEMKTPERRGNTVSNDAGRSNSIAVKSASRALDILEYVARASTPPSFLQISQLLNIPKSSLSILMTTLIRRGYLDQPEPRGGYRLGVAADRLAFEFSQGRSIAERIPRLLEGLAANTKESCGYYEARGDYVECLEARAFERALSYKTFVGERVRMYANSCGKALLAQLPDDLLNAYVARTEFRSYTEHTITSAGQLLSEVEEIRKTGIARSLGEYHPGAAAFAVALIERGKAVGAVNVGLPMSRLDAAAEEILCAELKLVASRFRQSDASLPV